MIDEKDMKIDKGEYWEVIKELSGATLLFVLMYVFICLGFCL
tara:strand:+ start:1527 stop:1652 length:126 start_codon:yes stop_codon:yes gene_type:complete